MEAIKIPFSGITRNTDDGICNDGECMELINARVINGAIEPINAPIKIASLSGLYDKAFFHSMVDKYIFITSDNQSLVVFDAQLTQSQILSPDVIGVRKVEFVGRTLCAITNYGIRYFLYKNDSYLYIGEKPNYSFSVWASDEKDIDITNKIYDCQFTDKIAGDLTLDYRDVDPFIDFLDSCKNEALAPYKDKARYADPICVRAALKMYDGTYISHSPIYLICPSNSIAKSIKQMSASYISKGSNTEYGAVKVEKWTLYSYLIQYNFSFDNVENWKDLILSLDIFISRPFSVIDIDACKEIGIRIGNVANQIQIQTFGKSGMLEKIMSHSSQMYLSISANNNEEDYIKEAQVSNDMLTDDNFTHCSLSADVSYVYNGRLHLGNIKNILYNGFMQELVSFTEDFNGCSFDRIGALLKIFTYITTDYGEKIVYKEGAGWNPLSSIFCYPDYRATKVIIYAAIPQDHGQALIYKKRELALKKSSSLNMAVYLGWNEGSIESGASLINLLNGNTITENEFENPPIEIDNIEFTPNKIKVSELNNPFTFPAKLTYTPSNEAIISLGSNTSAISQGQFGQYPLYVFCKDGIYSMQIGTGDVVYASSSPVSRDVCISSSICGLDAATAFSTTKGLMMITGSNIQCLSDTLDGFLPSCIVSSPIISKILKIASLDGHISSVVFRNYIEEAHIGYNYQRSEIIIANRHPYSYVYSLGSGTWYKISMQITCFVNAYPNTYAVVQKEGASILYDLNNNHRSIATMALLSRPIKLGTTSHKRILQTALRGIVKRALSDLYLSGEPVMFRGEGVDIFSDVGFYILGSNDGEHFSLVSGKESIVDVRDLVTKMNKSKAYKFFMVALVGGVRSDVSLNYVEMIANESFENRLR